MEITAWVLAIGGIVSALLAWVPAARFITEARKDMRMNDIAEGERRSILSVLRHDIDAAHNRIGCLDTRVDSVESMIIEIKVDMKHLVSTVDKIAQKVNA